MRTLVRGLAVFASLLPLACSGGEKPAAVDAAVYLTLPAYKEYPNQKRYLKITLDGKDVTEPKPASGATRRLDGVPVGRRAEIVVDFWPVNYSNTIRRRTFTFDGRADLTLDLSREDPAFPDDLRPIVYETADSLLDEMMALASVGEADTVLDIGCGDGRLVTTAVAKRRAKKGYGIDIREECVEFSRERAKREKVDDRCEFAVGDALKLADVSHASVVFLYLGEDLSARLEPVLRKTLKPGSRVVSLQFPVGEWKPDETKTVRAKNKLGDDQTFTLYLWKIK